MGGWSYASQRQDACHAINCVWVSCTGSTSEELPVLTSTISQTSFAQRCIGDGNKYSISVTWMNVDSSWQTTQLPKSKLEMPVMHVRRMQWWGCAGVQSAAKLLSLWLLLSVFQWRLGGKKQMSGLSVSNWICYRGSLATAWLGRKHSRLWMCMYADASALSPLLRMQFSLALNIHYILLLFQFQTLSAILYPINQLQLETWEHMSFCYPPLLFWQVKD